jgi:hypothetical protein
LVTALSTQSIPLLELGFLAGDLVVSNLSKVYHIIPVSSLISVLQFIIYAWLLQFSLLG